MGRGTDFHKFPTFSLEDKTLLDERGSDRKGQWHMEEKHDQPSWKVYSRRKKKGTRGRIKKALAGVEDNGFQGDKKDEEEGNRQIILCGVDPLLSKA